MIRSLAFFCASAALAGTLSPTESAVMKTIDAEASRTIQLLETLVNINSGTKNFAGVREVARRMQAEFEPLGFQVRWVPMAAAGRAGHLVAEHTGSKGKRILIIGHMDTVFELSSPFQKFVRTGDRAEGPGVEDTKGGLAVMVAAFRALKSAGALDPMRIRIVLTGDEENPGEPTSVSRADLFDAAAQSDVALEFEPGIRLAGKDYASTSRRGVVEWVLKTRGITGHSGQVGSPAMGDGAIKELTRILSQFASELPEKYLTFNVGLVLGGVSAHFNDTQTGGSASGKTNVIPGEAVAVGDLRMVRDEQTERAEAKMRAIVAKHLPKTGAEITFRGLMPPMSPDRNRALLAMFNA